MSAALRDMRLKETADKLDNGIEESVTYMDFPSQHWLRIRTNNVLEQLNLEIKRRTKVIGTFPDGNSALMLVRPTPICGRQGMGRPPLSSIFYPHHHRPVRRDSDFKNAFLHFYSVAGIQVYCDGIAVHAVPAGSYFIRLGQLACVKECQI